MFRFANPEYLLALLVLLPIAFLFVWFLRTKQKKLIDFGSYRLVNKLLLDNSVFILFWKFACYGFAYTFCILALAGPQFGSRQEIVKQDGVDVLIALDVSKSMLAQDILPNRMERAKEFINEFIGKLKGNRVGLTVFAGHAYIQMPITIDYAAAKMYLKTVNPEMIPTQGTALAEAIEVSAAAFQQDSKAAKVMIVISDGEDNESGALQAAKNARLNNIKIYTIGVGKDEGATIPLANGDLKRDAEGNVVITKTNQEALKEIAQQGGGKFYMLYRGNAIIDDIIGDIDKMEKTQTEEVEFVAYDDKFQWCIGIAIFFLILEWLLITKKINMFSWIKNNKILPLLFLLTTTAAFAQKERSITRNANDLMAQKKYPEAEATYRKALDINSKFPQAIYGLGNSLYQQKRYDEAIKQYTVAITLLTDTLQKAAAWHNIGNAYLSQNKIDDAIKAYKAALKLNAKDRDTKYNLAYANLKKKQQEQNKKDEKQQENQSNAQSENNNTAGQNQPAGSKHNEQNEKALEAARNSEQNTRNRINNQQQPPSSHNREKDW